MTIFGYMFFYSNSLDCEVRGMWAKRKNTQVPILRLIIYSIGTTHL